MNQNPSPFTVRCESQDLQNDVDAIADAMDRPRSWVVNQALKEFVIANKWQIQAIEEGIQSLDEDRYVSHEAVMSKLEKKLKQKCK